LMPISFANCQNLGMGDRSSKATIHLHKKTKTNICLVVTRIVSIQQKTEQGFLTNIFD
jgi:hypothetical protein